MRPEALAEASEWLRKAERDIRGAARTIEGPEPLADLAAYHVQQAVEKALKAFLVGHDQPFPKTHDLVYLVNSCRAIEPDFGRFLGIARAVNPYAFRFRYPGGPIEPDQTEVEEALQSAREVMVFVRDRLSGG